MAGSRYRAWRFLHPDLDASEDFGGLRISPTGGIDMVDGEQSIRQAVLLLLSTRRGERVMRPNYGCDLHKLAFDPNDQTTAGLAIHYVRRALEQWEPRIAILSLDATQNPEDPSRLDVSLEYRMRRLARPGRLLISIDLLQPEV
ncbi:MAG: GPW/gp25 family protein [Gammaproteobacteria bacterium]|nr:GPW/gp25 family protein [Gammaproteobacteria bacterium]